MRRRFAPWYRPGAAVKGTSQQRRRRDLLERAGYRSFGCYVPRHDLAALMILACNVLRPEDPEGAYNALRQRFAIVSKGVRKTVFTPSRELHTTWIMRRCSVAAPCPYSLEPDALQDDTTDDSTEAAQCPGAEAEGQHAEAGNSAKAGEGGGGEGGMGSAGGGVAIVTPTNPSTDFGKVNNFPTDVSPLSPETPNFPTDVSPLSPETPNLKDRSYLE